MTDAGREQARRAVAAELARRGWNPADLARQAGIDPGTARDFVAGERWAKIKTQGRIETALGWPHGRLNELEHELDASDTERVGGDGQGANVMMDLPAGVLDGLSPDEVEEALSIARAGFIKRARDIRRERQEQGD